MRGKVDTADGDQLVVVSVDFSKLSDAVKSVRCFFVRDAYNARIKNIKHKIPHINNVDTTTAFNAKITWG